jgi:hypothetical protein
MAQGRLYWPEATPKANTTFRGPLWLNRGHLAGPLWKHPFLNTFINQSISILGNLHYYIDRCELWGFIREINSDISHVKYQFFPAGTTFTQLQVWWLCPLWCYSEYIYDCKLKKFRQLLLTLEHNQHDVIDVIW